jgi:hypothetical protein
MEKKLNLAYTEKDGLLYPNISMESADTETIGRFGRQWMENMCRSHPQRCMTLRMQGKLTELARKVDAEALERQELIYQQNLAASPPPQTEDTLVKARHLNSLRLIAEEVVMLEIVMTPR